MRSRVRRGPRRKVGNGTTPRVRSRQIAQIHMDGTSGLAPGDKSGDQGQLRRVRARRRLRDPSATVPLCRLLLVPDRRQQVAAHDPTEGLVGYARLDGGEGMFRATQRWTSASRRRAYRSHRAHLSRRSISCRPIICVRPGSDPAPQRRSLPGRPGCPRPSAGTSAHRPLRYAPSAVGMRAPYLDL